MWESSMCESLVCGLNYGLHSIFKHANELYYCNLLNDESIQKTNNKNRCIDGMISCISKLYNLNLMFRHYFALLITITEFLNLLFETACLSSSVYTLNFAQTGLKSDFLLNQFML